MSFYKVYSLCISGILFALCVQFVTSLEFQEYKNLRLVSKTDFIAAINSDKLSMVYFYQQEFPALKKFLGIYDNGAKVLGYTGVKFLLVDCVNNPIQEYCSNTDKMKLSSYQDGEKFMDLELRHVFNEDSFVSNILQAHLLETVPIVLDRVELQSVANKAKGSKHLIVGYFPAIGSIEHRHFVELAYEMNHIVNFSMSTDKRIPRVLNLEKETSEFAVWLLKCKDMPKGENDDIEISKPCPAVRMFDKLNRETLTRFISGAFLPPIVLYKHDEQDPYSAHKIHIVYLYYLTDLLPDVKEVGEKLALDFSPSVGVILVDAEGTIDSNMTMPQRLPGIGVRLRYEKNITFMEESFNYDYCRNYVHNRLVNFMMNKDPVAVDVMEKPTDYSADNSLREEVEAIEQEMTVDDNEVALAAHQLKNVKVNYSQLTRLTDDNFKDIFKQRRILVVLYHLQFDPRSQLLLHTFANVSKLLKAKNVLAEVDCYHWKRVCDARWIRHYPQILVHRNTQQRVVKYEGRMDPQSLIDAVTLLMKDTFIEIKELHLAKQFLSGSYPDAVSSSPANISVLGAAEHDFQMEEYRDMAEQLHNLGYFYAASSKVAQRLKKDLNLKLPACIVQRHNDPYQPLSFYQNNLFIANHLREFVVKHQYPVFPELSVRTYPHLMREEKLLAILFTEDHTPNSPEWTQLAKLSASGNLSSDIACSWMDTSEQFSLGKRLMITYTQEKNSPVLVALSHKLGGVFKYSGSIEDQDSVINWLKTVQQNESQPIYKLRKEEWKPTHRSYDYLKMIDAHLYSQSEDEGTNDINVDTAESEHEVESASSSDSFSDKPEFNVLSSENSEKDLAELEKKYGLDKTSGATDDTAERVDEKRGSVVKDKKMVEKHDGSEL